MLDLSAALFLMTKQKPTRMMPRTKRKTGQVASAGGRRRRPRQAGGNGSASPPAALAGAPAGPPTHYDPATIVYAGRAEPENVGTPFIPEPAAANAWNVASISQQVAATQMFDSMSTIDRSIVYSQGGGGGGGKNKNKNSISVVVSGIRQKILDELKGLIHGSDARSVLADVPKSYATPADVIRAGVTSSLAAGTSEKIANVAWRLNVSLVVAAFLSYLLATLAAGVPYPVIIQSMNPLFGSVFGMIARVAPVSQSVYRLCWVLMTGVVVRMADEIQMPRSVAAAGMTVKGALKIAKQIGVQPVADYMSKATEVGRKKASDRLLRMVRSLVKDAHAPSESRADKKSPPQRNSVGTAASRRRAHAAAIAK